jgi:regulator of protease activity HflC (stomatin/prohibitin superfamily)
MILRFVALTLLLSACATVRPGEVAVKRSFGKLSQEARGPGLVVYGPIGTTYVRVPVRTMNLEVTLDLPSREGLNVRADVSILYRVQADQAPTLLEEVGAAFESELVLPVFRSSAADIAARYAAKDMHSGERSGIEDAIRDRMEGILAQKGILVESVLLKSIQLPPGLYAAVEEKLAAEQQAQRMQFVLERERQEAERRRIEAAGIRDAQKILEEGLTPAVLEWRGIEAFQQLATSPNAKVIVTNGTTPLLVDPGK